MNNEYQLNENPELGVFRRTTNILSNFVIFIAVFSLIALIITVIFKVLIINALVLEIAAPDVVLTIADINEFCWFALAFVISVVGAAKLSKKNIVSELYGDFF